MRWCCLMLSLCLSGCMAFEEQSLSFGYDRGADRLDIHQIYSGIHGKKGVRELLADEFDQLKTVMEGGRTFFFANWLYEINLPELKKHLEPSPETAESAHPEFDEAVHTFSQLLVRNVRIRNERFFLDPQERLSASQQVQISSFTEVLASLNRMITQAVLHDKNDWIPVASRPRFLDAAREDFSWTQVEGDDLVLRIPLLERDYKTVLDDLRAKGGKTGFTKMLGQEIRVSYAEGVATFHIGHPQKNLTTIRLRVNKQSSRNAVEQVRASWGLADHQDAAHLTDAFFLDLGYPLDLSDPRVLFARRAPERLVHFAVFRRIGNEGEALIVPDGRMTLKTTSSPSRWEIEDRHELLFGGIDRLHLAVQTAPDRRIVEGTAVVAERESRLENPLAAGVQTMSSLMRWVTRLPLATGRAYRMSIHPFPRPGDPTPVVLRCRDAVRVPLDGRPVTCYPFELRGEGEAENSAPVIFYVSKTRELVMVDDRPGGRLLSRLRTRDE